MSKTPVALGAASGVLVSFILLIVVLRSLRLGDWGDEHMEQMGAIIGGSILLGAIVGGILGHRVGRTRLRGSDRA